MKVNPIRIESQLLKVGPGTGKYKGKEIYPTTELLMTRLGMNKELIDKCKACQQKKLNTLPNLSSINKLRDYQKEDVMYLAARDTAACFNEQRTGKTPTALSVMKIRAVKKLLIIAPASTLYTWADECKNWWFSDMPAYVIDGSAPVRKLMIRNWTKGALIISYECLRERVRKTRDEQGNITHVEIQGDLGEILRHKDIQGCILDEAHRIKNHKSKQAEALFKLEYIPIRLALSGTPAPGKQHEIFSILHWLYPTVFTSYWRFIDYYFYKDEMWTSRTDTHTEIGTFKPNKDKELQQFLNAISTRRMRASVMDWIPDKTRIKVPLKMTDKQEKYITELQEMFEIEGTDITAETILSRLMKERQILLSPEVVGLKGSSPKIDWIKKYIEDYPEKNIIIFSNFTKWLKLLANKLDCENLIIGETTKDRREYLKTEFQAGRIKLLLINIKAGKEGLTLDNADVTIFTDKYPPVGDILQAEDRFVATSKDKLDRGHEVIDLVMRDSYEEIILAMLSKNAREVDIINNYKKYIHKEDNNVE